VGKNNIQNKILLLLITFTLLLRLSIGIFHQYDPPKIFTPDSTLYIELANNLLETGEFKRSTEGPISGLDNPGDREIFRTPGYPAILSILFNIFGKGLSSVIIFQVLLDSLSVVTCFLLTKRLFGQKVAILAGFLFSLDIGHIIYSNMIMSDVSFTFFISLTFLLVVLYLYKLKTFYIIFSALSLTIATSIRPVGFLLFIPILIYLFLKKVNKKLIIFFLIISLSFPCLWMLRNYIYFDSFSLSNAFHFNIYLVAVPKVKARVNDISFLQAQTQLLDDTKDIIWRSSFNERNRIFRELGLKILKEYPLATLTEAIRSVLEMILSGERRNFLRLIGNERGSEQSVSIQEGKRNLFSIYQYIRNIGYGEFFLIAFQIVWNAMMWIFCLFGFYHLKKDNMYREILLFGITIIYILGSSLVVGTARMRFPISFIIYLMAAYGICRGLSSFPNGWSLLRQSSIQDLGIRRWLHSQKGL
jgi:4-amino-4-deoxy-L-arabinose transferase-like glycosyltransferase